MAENSNKLYCSAYNSKICLQFSLIFLFFCLMGKGPGVLNTVLKKKHQLFKALANMSEASRNSYAGVLSQVGCALLFVQLTNCTQHS